MSDILFLRFYASLNDFLPASRRQVTYPCPFNPPVSVKHLVEAEGVPHPEVALILANGAPVAFSYLVQPGDRIAVYPALTNLRLPGAPLLRPSLPYPPVFILDNHLGRLARYLRLLGFDALYPSNQFTDQELAQLAHEQNRVMLTRDRGLLMRNLVIHGYCLRSMDPRQQLLDVLHRFQLRAAVKPWQRCLRCNGLLASVDKAEILERLAPKTKKYYDDFKICPDCRQIYWQGSHFAALQELVTQAVTNIKPSNALETVNLLDS